MSLFIFDVDAAVSKIKNSSVCVATTATSEEKQQVTKENHLRQTCDKLRQVGGEKDLSQMSQNVANMIFDNNINENNVINTICRNVANVATGIKKKEPLPDIAHLHEYMDSKSVPLFTNVNGKPLHCIHCPAWLQGQGVWWSGTCLHTGESRTNKSRCDFFAYEEKVYGK